MLNKLFSPVGVQVRNFIVEYHNKKMISLHQAIQIPEPVGMADAAISDIIRSYYKRNGYVVYLIIEILGEYTLTDLDALTDDTLSQMKVALEGKAKQIYLNSDEAFI